MRTIIISITILIASITVYSQEKLKLDSAIQICLENNYGIKISENNVESMKNNAIPANAGLMPRIDISAGVNYNDNTTQTDVGEIQQKTTLKNTGISLSYTLFDGLSNINNYKKLKEIVKASEYQNNITIEATIYRLINYYYSAIINYENLNINKDMLEISRERYEKAKVNKEFGKSNGLALLNAEVDYNNDSINYLNAKNSYTESKRNLNSVLSREPEFDFDIISNIPEFKRYDINQLKEEIFKNNVSYKLIENTLTQSEFELKILKGNFMPVLSFNTSYGYNHSVKDFGFQMDNPNASFSTGLTLSFNVFDGGRKRKQVQNAKIAIENNNFKLQDEKIQLLTEMENSYANYTHNLEILETNETNLKATELNFLRSKEYYNLGQISSTQFREAQLNYSRAKVNIVISKISAKLSEVVLIYLSGNILK